MPTFLGYVCLLCIIVGLSQARIFPMTEGKDTNVFYLGLGEQRRTGDIWIPYQTPVDNLRYFFNWDRRVVDEWVLGNIIAGISEAQRALLMNIDQNCKDLFSPGTFVYRPFKYSGTLGLQKIERDADREVTIRPADNLDQSPFILIRSCCDPVKCQEKCFAVPKSEVAFYIIDPDRKHVILNGQCTYCALKSCVEICPSGTYATNYVSLDQVKHLLCEFRIVRVRPDLCNIQETGLQKNYIECLPCRPGTWNTCLYKETCNWYDDELNPSIYLLTNIPS